MGYTKISGVVIISFVFAFGVFSFFTYIITKKNILEETEAVLAQAKLMHQKQVSIDAMEDILSLSPHLSVERFYGRLNVSPIDIKQTKQRNSLLPEEISPVIVPLSENSFLIVRPDNDAEFEQNMAYFYMVALLFVSTLALLLWVIRAGIKHQLKSLKNLSLALSNTLKNNQIDIEQVVLPQSEFAEIQSVFDEYSALKISLLKKEQQLVNADKKLALLQEEERSYLARELHDNVGQLITSANAYAHILTNTSDTKVIRECGNKIKSFCQQINQAIRVLTDHLHPLILDKVELWEAIEKLIADHRQILSNIEWVIDIDVNEYVADHERDLHLYRIIQECLNNIIKHSQASKVHFTAITELDKMIIRISDNGIGISNDKKNGLGLYSLKSRARCIGAELAIESEVSGGTQISLKMNIINQVKHS